MFRLTYDKPEVEYWPAETLNKIEATMSETWSDFRDNTDEDGDDEQTPIFYVYLVNTPNNDNPALNIVGHSAIVFQSGQGKCELYSFHPCDNKSSDTTGSIARAVNLTNFSDFMDQCRNGGILVNNGYESWYEKF